MKTTTILILGGYGNAGSHIAKLLLHHTDASIIIAGRNKKKAEKKVEELKKKNSGRVGACPLDVADKNQLKAVFQKCDLAIIAAATIPHVETIIKTAIETGTDYLDTQLSFPEKINVLKKYKETYSEKNRTIIADGGFHPGVPAAMVQYAATHFDQLKKANISSYLGIKWNKFNVSPNTLEEFTHEIKNFDPTVFRNKKWEKIPFRNIGNFQFDFAGDIGRRNCVPLFLHELETLPEKIPSLEETGFFIAGFNWVTDNIVTPIAMVGAHLNISWLSQRIGRFYFWSAGTFSKPPYVSVLQMEATGIKNNKESFLKIILSHEDAYFFTAAPVVACVRQYLKYEHEPGFYYQANFADATAFLQDIAKMGVNVRIAKS
ncbi:MAG: SDR family NAD(P)-dependent oxidoreductase [Bacteroidota bacterium]